MADKEFFSNESLSAEEVMSVLKMAQYIYQGGFGWSSPDLANQTLIGLNNTQLAPTREKLNKALERPLQSQDELIAYSQFAESFDRLYKRTIDYYAGLLSFDLEWTCTNMSGNNWNNKEYQDDVKRVSKFFDRFKYKAEFSRVVRECIRNGVYYTWLRDTTGMMSKSGVIDIDDKRVCKTEGYTLQTMPQKWCKLTGKWDKGWLYSFDMSYFTQAGTYLQSYDPIFREYWKNVFGDDKDVEPYNPIKPLNERDTTFAMWTDTSPEHGAFVFLMDDTNANSAPLLAPLIRNTISDIEMEKLQHDVNILAARGIITGEIPLMDKSKSGQVPNQSAWDIKTLTKFMTLVKNGLDKSINAVALPLENTKFHQFDDKDTNDLYDKQLSGTAGNAASASRLIYSSGKVSQAELQAQIQTDCNFIGKLYHQFEAFLNYYVNKKTRIYKFNFRLSGYNYDFLRETQKKALLDLANVGFVLNPTAYAKIVGYEPQEFLRSLEEGHNTTTKNLTQLLSIYTQSSKDAGRPEKDDLETAESTQAKDNL